MMKMTVVVMVVVLVVEVVLLTISGRTGKPSITMVMTLAVMDMVVDVDLLTIFSRTGRPSIVMGEDQPPFIWDHVNAANASHLNIGNMMMMDQVTPITSM